MPIKFSIYPEKGYFVSKFIGRISDKELVGDFKSFFESDMWDSSLDELVDLSEGDGRDITSSGVKALASFSANIFTQHGRWPRVAVYAPRDLSYGLARMYTAYASRPERHRIFRDYNDAEIWLCEKKVN